MAHKTNQKRQFQKAPGKPRYADEGDETRQARPETHRGETWLYGHHAVLAALANPERKNLRLVLAAQLAEDPGIKTIVSGSGLQPQILPREEIQRLLPSGAVHQGIALLTRGLPATAIDDILEQETASLVLMLDQVTDPHNVGAILRSAAAFGAAAVIVQDRHAPEVSGALAKSASGAAEHVPLVRAVNLTRALEQLKKAGFWSVGLAGEAEQTLSSLDLAGRVCLVLGAEGDGLRRLTREACDTLARLPTSGPVASLNVSNAAAVALYEIARLKDIS